MDKFRIVGNGQDYKVQKRVFLFFWATEQRPEDLDNKDFGGPITFNSKEQAQKYIESQIEIEYKVVK